MRLTKRIEALEKAATGGGGGRQVSKHLAQQNLGKTPNQLLVPAITIEVEDFALVELIYYAEFADPGSSWWTPCVVDNGAAVYVADSSPAQPLGGGLAQGLPWAWVALLGEGLSTGTPAASGPQAVSAGSVGIGNVVTLPAGSHALSLGVPAEFNPADGTWPDLVVRNVVFSASAIK